MRIFKPVVKSKLPLVVFVVLFIGSLAAWQIVRLAVFNQTQTTFDNDVIRINERIADQTMRIGELSQTMRNLFLASTEVESDEFDIFATEIVDAHNPTILAIEYAEFGNGTEIRAKYSYPSTFRDSALGDLNLIPAISNTLLTASQTSSTTISLPVTLPLNGQNGLALLVPFIKPGQTHPTGYVITWLDPLALFSPSPLSDQSVKYNLIVESTTPNPEGENREIVYKSTPIIFDENQAFFTTTKSLDFANRKWQITIQAPHSYRVSAVEAWAEPLMLIGGILITFLVVGVLRALLTARNSAEQIAADKTRSLNERDKQLSAITETAQDAIVMMDDQGKIVFWNAAATRMFGHTREEVLGKPLHELLATQAQHLIRPETLARFGLTGESAILEKSLEVPVKRKDGTMLTAELTVGHAQIDDKWFAVGILRDITERKALDDQLQNQALDLQKFKLAVEYANNHIIITDPDGFILYANRAVGEITGFSPSEVIGKKAGGKELWGGQMEKSFYEKLWQTIKVDKQIFTGTVKNKHKDGSSYTAQASIAPVLDETGNIKFFVGIERDITRETEVDRMKTEFISLASHQLRTPLSAMRWYLELLLGGDIGKLTKEQTEFITSINVSNDRMIALVNALLNVTRIESGRIIINPEPTNVGEMLNDILAELKTRAESKNQRITTTIEPDLPLVSLDPRMVRHVYLNLIVNAIKYSPDGSEIQIYLSQKDGELISQVSDHGYGIPPSEQYKVFEKFFRASNAVQIETDGTGLGLYLAKAVVEASGGKLWFESEPGKGTTFYFSLPIGGIAPKNGEVYLDA